MNKPAESSADITQSDPLFRSDKRLPNVNADKLLDLIDSQDIIRDIFYDEGTVFNPGDLRNSVRNRTFLNVWLKRVVVENVQFHDCIFEDCRMIGTRFLNCEFHDCQFKRCNTHKIQFEHTYINPSSFVEMPDRKHYSNIGVHTYQQLFRNSVEEHQPDFSATAEFEFKKWQRFDLAAKWRDGDPHRFRIARRWVSNLIFSGSSGYGLRPSRLVGWLFFGLVLAITFNYRYWKCFDFHSSAGLNLAEPTVQLAIYYSVVTLTTLGYGDITPQSNFGLVASSVEVILGLLGLTLLASALIKKVLR